MMRFSWTLACPAIFLTIFPYFLFHLTTWSLPSVTSRHDITPPTTNTTPILIHTATPTKDVLLITSLTPTTNCHSPKCKVHNSTVRHQLPPPAYTPPQSVQQWLPNNPPITDVSGVKLLINPSRLCDSPRALDFLMLVESAVTNSARRTAIRDTFARRDLFRHVTQRVAFLLGATPDPVTSRKIADEAAEFRDVIQGDFLDSYNNLTLKGLVGFQWVTRFCSSARVVVKLDDDVLVNVYRLAEKILPMFSGHTRHQIACKLWKNGTSRIKRGEVKHAVESSKFAGVTFYPFQYCWGFFVIMSADLIPAILEAAKVTPYFWIEDVYLFGLLPLTIGDVTVLDVGRNLTSFYAQSNKCLRVKRDRCEYFVMKAGHRQVEETRDFARLWSLLDKYK